MPKDEKDTGATKVKPPYKADWKIDAQQAPDVVLERHRRNAASPAAHEAFRKAVEDKVERFGVIHIDPATDYRARFHPAA